MNSLRDIQKEFKKSANPSKAKILQGFFKTKKGEYAEGDIFHGVTVPKTRIIAKRFCDSISLEETQELLHSKIHEERLCALIILIEKYKNKKTTPIEQKKIYEIYLKNTKYINNWDLVDLSAQHIVGNYLYLHPTEQKVLDTLATSELLWERRIAILSTFYFIYKKEFYLTLKLSKVLLNDKEDLMHKAVGWMLREVGKRGGMIEEEKFLQTHYKQMPRTMLRYAIERFPEKKRLAYLKGTV
ncbi:MAG: DNA alkylation repair protein [archaeon]|jgi:3-methyladenine DNA glycosylase AlkD